MIIGIVNYGLGNIRSIKNALSEYKVILVDNEESLLTVDVLILPGVGAFGFAMENLRSLGLVDAIRGFAKSGKRLIGICLGMQLLYESSFEHGEFEGLGILKGKVIELPNTEVIPHMGWNRLTVAQPSEGLYTNQYMYFVHSYYVVEEDEDQIVASTFYGTKIPAIVKKDNIIGFQGHPEKSGNEGQQWLKMAVEGKF